MSSRPFSGDGRATLEPEVVDGMYVSGNFFDVLGLRARDRHVSSVRGTIRVGSADAAVAVISWSYWQSRFNLDPAVLGRSLVVNGVPTTIIGVTPREFFGLQLGMDPPLWLPVATGAVDSEAEPPGRRLVDASPRGAAEAWRNARAGAGGDARAGPAASRQSSKRECHDVRWRQRHRGR